MTRKEIPSKRHQRESVQTERLLPSAGDFVWAIGTGICNCPDVPKPALRKWDNDGVALCLSLNGKVYKIKTWERYEDISSGQLVDPRSKGFDWKSDRVKVERGIVVETNLKRLFAKSVCISTNFIEEEVTYTDDELHVNENNNKSAHSLGKKMVEEMFGKKAFTPWD